MLIKGNQAVEVEIDKDEQKKIIFEYFQQQYGLRPDCWIDSKDDMIYFSKLGYHGSIEDCKIRIADEYDKAIIKLFHLITYGKTSGLEQSIEQNIYGEIK